MLATRPRATESVAGALPTITCSSCSDPIPLSALGEHVCRPSRPSASRPAARPTHIAIPSNTTASSAGSWRGPSSFDRAPPRPAFAGPSSVSSSPGARSLNIPHASNSPIDGSIPSAASGAFNSHSPSPQTPSPTNPFFPAISHNGKNGGGEYGLGLSISHRPEGPFPTDAPLPAGVSDLSNISTGAGMAGVGRRAFQAAAWGVTAGLSVASSARSRQEAAAKVEPVKPFAQPRSAGPSPTSLPPWQKHLPTPLEPPIPPSAPLANRSRSNPISRGPDPSLAVKPTPLGMPPRSASALDKPAEPVLAPPRATSALSNKSPSLAAGPDPPAVMQDRPINSQISRRERSSDMSVDESISNLLKARQGERKGSSDKADFFNRYKEMQRTASQSSHGTSRFGSVRASREHIEPVVLVESPRESVDLDGDGSCLPWATPAMASPPRKGRDIAERTHNRQPTAESAISSASSRSTTSAASSTELVTPGQSLEGNSSGRKDGLGYEARTLNLIEENDEDENERVVFGPPHNTPNYKSRPPTEPVRQRPPNPRAPSAPSVKRVKTCQKCGITVGGPQRFVERDGVVLCEADWKRMYLPTCRRCDKLIETRMVSADDGQLKGKWHASCFTCTRCDQPFEGGDFYVHAGRPWCQYHYAQETGTLCAAATCRRPIEGACILTQGSNPQRYHPGHLRCDHAGCQDGMDEYYDVAGQRFCERHVGGATRRGGLAAVDLRAEKRKTRLVDLPRGGLVF